VLLAVFVGRTILQSPTSELVAASGDGLAATGPLAEALSSQIGGEPSTAAQVTIVATFLAKSGEYCRAFTAQAPEHIAGVACRAEAVWRIHTLTQDADGGESEYRMAGSSLPSIVLQTVESMRVGEALDAEQEAAARAQDWQTGN
jgi:hypothetical protein